MMFVLQSTTNHSIIFGYTTREAFVLNEVGTAPVGVAVRVGDFLIVNEAIEN